MAPFAHTLSSNFQTNQNYKMDYQMNDLVYHPPINTSIHGDYFNEVNEKLFQNLLPSSVSIDRNNVDDFMFLAAVSSGHYERYTALVESFQVHFPKAKLVVYDLGFSKAQLRNVSNTIFSVLPGFGGKSGDHYKITHKSLLIITCY